MPVVSCDDGGDGSGGGGYVGRELGAVDGEREGMRSGRRGHLTICYRGTQIAVQYALQHEKPLAVVPVFVHRLVGRT